MTITVHGVPAPQGSKRHVGRGVMVESSKKVKPWRQSVMWAAIESGEKFPAQVSMEVTFFFQHPKTGKRRKFHTTRPDLDKLIRSTCDALTESGVYRDDSMVVSVLARKQYADEASPVSAGAVITIWEAA